MYVTSHRVKSAKGIVGINTYYHTHDEDGSGGEIDWEAPNAALIAETAPGKFVAERLDLPPGGNMVMSYLDVACRDGCEIERIANALGDARERLASGKEPFSGVFKGVGVRFGYQHGLVGAEVEEFDALAGEISQILENPTPPQREPGGPVEVHVTMEPDKLVYVLAEASKERLRQKHNRSWNANRRVTVSYETRMEFERDWGDIIPHVIYMLTDLSGKQVALMGGVRLLEKETKKVVCEWPEGVHAR